MTWYKIAKDFTDRNLLNTKIAYLKDIKENLERLSKLIFQSHTKTHEIHYGILQNKKLSSYPILRNMIIEANSIIYDNPWKFAYLCKETINEINIKISHYRKERDNMGDSKQDRVFKGWR